MAGQILIVDDHDLIRKSLRSLISSHSEWQICGEAADGIEAIDKARALRPGIVLMDISMPRMNGLDATRIIRKELPGSKVIIVSQNDPAVARRQAEDVDAAAYVSKSNLAKDLLPTLSRVAGTECAEATPQRRRADEGSTAWLAGGGELAKLIREFDWSKTPLGPIDRWAQSLKTSLDLILNSQHPMWIGWGKDITFLYNDAYIQVLSRAKHPQALGRPAQEVWAEIWDICGPLADKVFRKGEASFGDDVQLFMNRGDFVEETYYSFSYSPIRDESGQVAGLFCPSTEVTPKVINARRLRTLSELSAQTLTQKTTEAACSSAAETLSKNLDDIPFAVLYLVSGDGRVARLEQTCGVGKDLGSLTPDSIALTNETADDSLWPIANVLRTAQAKVVPVHDVAGLPLGLAQQKISEAIVLPVASRGEERPFGVLVAGVNPARKLDVEYRTFYELVAGQIATAIQNARTAEAESERMAAMAEIDRAKTAFFSNVSHEFRTPLTLMLGPVEDLLARSHTDLSPAAKSQLELVNRNGARLLRLVNTLLDFSRIEAGRMQAVYQPTDLAAFTVELASVFRSATEKAGLQLEMYCPKLSEPVFIDRNMWEKIVLNLISNAFKFTFDGKIAVSLAEVNGHAELRVRDTGVGIPAQELPRLFDRFHRVENTRSRTHEGSGIGLALVQELVKLHGGTVKAESEPGKGTTFIVSIPLGTDHLPAERIGGSRGAATTAVGAAPFVEEALRWLPNAGSQADAPEVIPENELVPVPCPPGAEDGNSEKRPLILVADDNADMRQYLVRMLSERYRVQAVADGRAALEAMANSSPQLVLTDVMMPNLDGFGLLRELRSAAKTKTIPVILLSARAGEESRVEGMEHGADDYLIKPFSARELLARVQTHLEMSRMRREAEEALRDTKARLEATLAATKVATWTWDIVNDRLVADQNLARIFSISAEDAAGVSIQKYFEVVHPEDRRRVEEGVQQALLTPGAQFEMDYRVVRPGGEIRWVTARGKVENDPEGKPVRFPGVLIDITDRRQIEDRERYLTAEAIAANAKFRAVFDQTSVFAGIMALDGTVLDVNRLALEACGYQADEVLGKPFWNTGWWLGSEEVQAKIRTATERAAQGTPYREVLPYYLADGTERLVEFALHPIIDPDGQVIFLHPTGVDITDLKRAEENYRKLAETLDGEVRVRTSELEQRNSEILQQSKLLQHFSQRLMKIQDEERRRIARELHDSAGQLLAALSMNLERAAHNARQHTPAIAEDVSDSQALVQQLSQEIRTMSYLLHPPLLDEAGLPDALRWYARGLTERSGIDVALTMREDFGRLPRELELVIFRLVQECLTNIHRHSGSKSADIRIAREGQAICLDVRDQGKGISAERLSEIQSQGSGVGIRGMGERVRQFNGDMKIESNGDGTTISFSFPLADAG